MTITSTFNSAALAVGVFICAAMLVMAVVSLRENEKRAAGRALILAILLPIPFWAAGLVSFAGFSSGLLLLTVLFGVLLMIPLGKRRYEIDDVPTTRIDERDVMFSRMRLSPGTERFEEYYRNNPENKKPDDNFRAKPGLLSKTAKYYDAFAFAAADANFSTVKSFRPLVAALPAETTIATDPAKVTAFIKRWALELGVVSIGVTELYDYHCYTTVGRGEDYGKPLEKEHRFAIALTVEMNKAMVDSAPLAPTVVESAQQYLSSGTIAVQIAEFIRNLGYPARAHIDGRYRVVCPLVARDAGLGEIGRMGLLMTPELGPRVRIAVVTTDLPLVVDRRRHEPSTIDFCLQCKKCAEVCPSRAIPFDDMKEMGGVRRWRIDSEACFTYWCVVGTDCARCMKACPYSHPDNWMHNAVRAGIRNSSLFRTIALKMDDFFYGRKPPVSDIPDWMKS